MKSSQQINAIAFLLVTLTLALAPTVVSAATIFESGTLGPTGIPSIDINSGATPGTSIDLSVYVGVRFQLNQPVATDQIGGHFVSGGLGTFFGAIVKLDNENDTPDSFDFSTPDFLGSTSLTFPFLSSDEVFGNLALSLDPGWYALVFGSGLFGTSGDGNAVRNGIDIGNPTYIAAQPFSGVSVWVDINSDFPNHRFVVNGQIVPEASSMALAGVACILGMQLKERHS